MTAVCPSGRTGGARRASRKQRSSGRWLWPVIWPAAHVLWLLACEDGSPQPISDVDAAVQACEVGEEACYCRGGGGCRDGLLCIAGRCLAAEPPAGGDPVTMGQRSAPQIPTRPGQTPPDPGVLIVVIPEPNDGGALDAAPDARSLPADASSDGG